MRYSIKDKFVSYEVSPEKILNAKPVLNPHSLEQCIHFIKERYLVHLKKDIQKLPFPWTRDPVISGARFTNIKREHDRESRLLIKSVCENEDLTLEEKILNIMVFRAWNKFETFNVLEFPKKKKRLDEKEFKHVEETVKEYTKMNPQYVWFTSAFSCGMFKTIWASEEGKADSANRDPIIPRRVLNFWNYLIKNDVANKIIGRNPGDLSQFLVKEVLSVGTFLAFQQFVDFTYIADYPYTEDCWTISGPGCTKGLMYLFYVEKKKTDIERLKWETDVNHGGLTPEELLFWLRDNPFKIFGEVLCPVSLMTDLEEDQRYLTVANWENIMCEFQKYYKITNCRANPRNRYRPNLIETLF